MSTPTWEEILGGMIDLLTPIKIPNAPAVAPPGAYLRHLDRYTGQFDAEAAMKDSGLAGRTPAVFVAFAGEKVLKEMVGRRGAKVQGTFLAICASDQHRTRKDHDDLYRAMRDVRRLLVGGRTGLAMTRFLYEGILVVAERPEVFAYAVKVSSVYQVDFTTLPGDVTDLTRIEGTVSEAGAQLGDLAFDRPPDP